MVVYECLRCFTRQASLTDEVPAKCRGCMVGKAFLRVLFSDEKARGCGQEVTPDGEKEHGTEGPKRVA